MKKLKLDLDNLRVDSFDTTPATAAGEPGTVYGHIPPETFRRWCSDGLTCDSCGGTCDSCGGTCDTCYQSCNGTCNTCYTACGTCPGNFSCDGSCYSCGYTCDASCGGSCDWSCGGTCGGGGCDTITIPI